MNRDGSQNNHKSVPSFLKGRGTSCFDLRSVPIITVSGAHSGVGKTSVLEALLRIVKGYSCLKVTVTHRKGKCPLHKECHTCDQLDSGFSIISDKKIIETEGKDTARFKAAGAKKVLWLKAKPQALGAGLRKVIPLFHSAKGLIIESNSALTHLRPDFSIFVKRKNSILKPSAKRILNKIDLVITLCYTKNTPSC